MPAPNQQDAADRLGTEPVSKLLLRFSVPAIVGMLVQALYNVVDRIFVGRGVNEIALGGLALVMPLMTISFAFAMLFGIGSANMISMRLGQQRRDEAANALGMGFLLLVASGLLVMFLGLIFMQPLLTRLGAQEGSLSLDYGRRYFEIILYGAVFNMIGFGMSHCTRAQGFPLMTMTAMFIGAGMNMILDPLFIFVFHWGVEGAAWATIISQFCSSLFIVYFVLSKKAVVRLNFKKFKPSLRIATQIMGFGSSQCLMQLAMASVQFVFNWSMGKYGASSLGVENGGDIALSGMNIVQSLAMLILMPTFGINQGAQPVLGYNYGAQKFGRVRRAYFTAVGGASIICILGFLGCQLFSLPLIRIFAPNGSDALIYFTPLALRIGTIILPLVGFQVVSSNFFAVTGRPKVSSVLALLRQVLVLIPCLFLFGRLWGLRGLICATPVADGVAVLVTAVFIFRELKYLNPAKN